MTIKQLNNYLPGQNLNNLAANVNYNALGVDGSNISVSFSASPATVTVALGSMWETNGDRYAIQDAPESFTMASAAHNYITHNEATGFSSAATVGTWSALKQGFYQADNITRTLAWYIDQTEEFYNRSLNILQGQTQDPGFSENIQLANGFQQFNQIKVFTGNLNASGVAVFDSGLSDLENYIVLYAAWRGASAFSDMWNGPFSPSTGSFGIMLYTSTASSNANKIDISTTQVGSASAHYRVVIAKAFS